MSAEIIHFTAKSERDKGNGAREAMIEHILECPNVSQSDAEAWADFTLADLWLRGFKVVPLETEGQS
jgi:hypothetical protein